MHVSFPICNYVGRFVAIGNSCSFTMIFIEYRCGYETLTSTSGSRRKGNAQTPMSNQKCGCGIMLSWPSGVPKEGSERRGTRYYSAPKFLPPWTPNKATVQRRETCPIVEPVTYNSTQATDFISMSFPWSSLPQIPRTDPLVPWH